MLEYAISEAILKFPASETTENAQGCWIRVHFGACVCIGIVCVYLWNKHKLRNGNYNEATAGFKLISQG